jgi:hypothetical protein
MEYPDEPGNDAWEGSVIHRGDVVETIELTEPLPCRQR